MQILEKSISEAKHNLEALTSARRDAQTDLTSSIRARTELEMLIADIRSGAERTGDQRTSLQSELQRLQEQITRKERDLATVLPEWEASRSSESTEKRRLDEASARLSALFAKQGRVSKFRTKAERDTFLKQEIKSMEAYKTSQSTTLENTRSELEVTRRSLTEVEAHITSAHEKIEDGRRTAAELSAEVVLKKGEQAELVERRKEMWREDSKVDGLMSRAAEELGKAERVLAGMMDKVRVLFQRKLVDTDSAVNGSCHKGYGYGFEGGGQNRGTVWSPRRLWPPLQALRS